MKENTYFFQPKCDAQLANMLRLQTTQTQRGDNIFMTEQTCPSYPRECKQKQTKYHTINHKLCSNLATKKVKKRRLLPRIANANEARGAHGLCHC